MIICSGLELIEKLEELPYSGVRGAGIIATNAVSMPHRSNIFLNVLFPAWLGNRFISVGLKPVLSHTKKSCISSYYRYFITNIKNISLISDHNSIYFRNGKWLFPTFSFLSHSCISNARFFPCPGNIQIFGKDSFTFSVFFLIKTKT